MTERSQVTNREKMRKKYTYQQKKEIGRDKNKQKVRKKDKHRRQINSQTYKQLKERKREQTARQKRFNKKEKYWIRS